MRSVGELKNIRGKRILVRVDFNCPIEKGKVGDNTKIVAAIPTIEFLIKKGAKVILMTHLGRPAAKREAGIRNYELGIIAERLGALLKKKVEVVQGWDFERIREAIGIQKPRRSLKAKSGSRPRRASGMKSGQLLMLPNLRLHQGEEKNSKAFAIELSSLAQLYVNEAFGVSHRKHASLVGVPKLLVSYAGLRLIEEVEALSRVLHETKRPLLVLMGGGKITDKMAMLKTMLRRADNVLLGGALATHLYKAMGYEVGSSRIEADGVKFAKKLIDHKKIILPKDLVIGTADGEEARVVEAPVARLTKPYTLAPSPLGIWDIGPQTILAYAQYIKNARTLIWNGPMGIYEVKRYSHGTIALGRLFASRSRGKAFGVVGGGETIDALNKTGLAEYVDFISTGGGAMLEFLSGKKLPGIAAL